MDKQSNGFALDLAHTYTIICPTIVETEISTWKRKSPRGNEISTWETNWVGSGTNALLQIVVTQTTMGVIRTTNVHIYIYFNTRTAKSVIWHSSCTIFSYLVYSISSTTKISWLSLIFCPVWSAAKFSLSFSLNHTGWWRYNWLYLEKLDGVIWHFDTCVFYLKIKHVIDL